MKAFKSIKIAANTTWKVTKKNIPLIIAQILTRGIISVFSMMILPVILKILFDSLQKGKSNEIFTNCFIATCVLILLLFITYLNDVIIDTNLFSVFHKNIVYSFTRYHHLDFEKTRKQYDEGDVFNRITSGSMSIPNMWISLFLLIANLIGIVGLFSLCIDISWYLALMAIIFSVVNYIRIKWLTKKNVYYKKKTEVINGKCETALHETIHEMQFAKMFDVQDKLIKRYKAERKDLWSINKKAMLCEALSSMIVDGVNSVFKVLLPVVLFPLSLVGKIMMGSITSAFTLLDSLQNSISQVIGPITSVANSFVSIDRLHDLLNLEETKNKSEYKDNFENDSCIQLSDVSLKLGDRDILDNVSLSILQGKKVAIIGKNGSGKSTIIRLLLGLYEPQEGSVLTYGNEISELTVEQKRKLLSFIPSRNQMFSETGKTNILMSAEQSEDDSYDEVIKKASIPKECDSFVNKVCTNISGGQAERINIARGIIRNTPILIADEPTASLDPDIANQVMKSILDTNQTVIVVTHNPKFLSYFDNIIIINNGKVVKQGTYDMIKEDEMFVKWVG